jgi:hypothetical protein
MVDLSSLKPATTVACSRAMLNSKAETANTDDMILKNFMLLLRQLIYDTDMHVHVHAWLLHMHGVM